MHRQIFIVCFSKFSLFESQSGQPFKKCSTPRFFKCTISEVNVHCRNFRNESVSVSKPSKMNKKRIQNAPPEDRSFSWHCLHFFEESQLQLMFYVFIVEVAIVVPLFSFSRHVVSFCMYYILFCTLPFQT